ncbi:hypothetical protein BD410DRAFT_163505 [Rickenella mellea]|uniref:Uncharacterized protein n=1 Tax=Rickenella mellea TaxID=50990 RepID=A0A4Y7Q856_9AGAM|nr:hypothetical protein BD410DRAFT_163505 [Rickenella mellea]
MIRWPVARTCIRNFFVTNGQRCPRVLRSWRSSLAETRRSLLKHPPSSMGTGNLKRQAKGGTRVFGVWESQRKPKALIAAQRHTWSFTHPPRHLHHNFATLSRELTGSLSTAAQSSPAYFSTGTMCSFVTPL